MKITFIYRIRRKIWHGRRKLQPQVYDENIGKLMEEKELRRIRWSYLQMKSNVICH